MHQPNDAERRERRERRRMYREYALRKNLNLAKAEPEMPTRPLTPADLQDMPPLGADEADYLKRLCDTFDDVYPEPQPRRLVMSRGQTMASKALAEKRRLRRLGDPAAMAEITSFTPKDIRLLKQMGITL